MEAMGRKRGVEVAAEGAASLRTAATGSGAAELGGDVEAGKRAAAAGGRAGEAGDRVASARTRHGQGSRTPVPQSQGQAGDRTVVRVAPILLRSAIADPAAAAIHQRRMTTKLKRKRTTSRRGDFEITVA